MTAYSGDRDRAMSILRDQRDLLPLPGKPISLGSTVMLMFAVEATSRTTPRILRRRPLRRADVAKGPPGVGVAVVVDVAVGVVDAGADPSTVMLNLLSTGPIGLPMVRTRAGEDLKSMPVFQFIDRLQDEIATAMEPEEAGPDLGG